MTSAYEQSASAWQQAGGEAGPRHTEPAPATLAGDVPQDPWGTVRYLANNARDTTTVERDIGVVFEQRRTISKRLSDSCRRQDDKMAAQAAQDWVKTEVALHKLFGSYAKHVADRNSLIEGLTDGPPAAIQT